MRDLLVGFFTVSGSRRLFGNLISFLCFIALLSFPVDGLDTTTTANWCESGQFLTKDDSCESCSAGSFSRLEMATGCLLCSPGFHQPEKGKTDCEYCKEGFYQPEYGAMDCIKCPLGTYGRATALSKLDCQPCEEGSYGVSTIYGEECRECDPGTWSYDEGSTDSDGCTSCPAGSFTPGGWPCTKCFPGTYADKEGSKACERCPRGTMTYSRGATHCDPIATAQTSDL